MISVVIPLYNKETFVTKTLQSVLKQTFSEFEVWVVNDGSTDASLAVVSQIVDPRIKIISIENSGVSVARNTGIEKAKFDWIAFLDADDWWAPTFLEEIQKAIQSFPKEKIFAGGRCRVFADRIENYENPYLPKKNETGLVNYFKIISRYLPPINSSNVVVGKELLFQNGLFRSGMRQHEDHDLWIRLCQSNNVVFVNKTLSYYRKDLEVSASANPFQFEDFIQYVKDIAEVNEKITSEEKLYFKKYYNRFLPIRYFQSYYLFNSNQRMELLKASKGLLSSKNYFIIKTLNFFSFIDVYKIYKKLKR